MSLVTFSDQMELDFEGFPIVGHVTSVCRIHLATPADSMLWMHFLLHKPGVILICGGIISHEFNVNVSIAVLLNLAFRKIYRDRNS